jgi:hypothetical protein
MSDNYIVVIPEDYEFIPVIDSQQQAENKLLEIVGSADEIQSNVFPVIEFHDCGGNFEAIFCPYCNAKIEITWWHNRMDEDYNDKKGFLLKQYRLPCCDKPATLHQLNYHSPQGFGQFTLEAMNPRNGIITPFQIQELESILKCKIRVIYQHL